MKLAAAIVLALAFPTLAAAQHSGIYIQGGPLFDFLTSAGATAYPNISLLAGGGLTWTDVNPVTSILPAGDLGRSGRWMPGASAAIGVFITPSISLRAEGSFQTDEIRSDETISRLGLETRESNTITDVIVAAGWHQGGTRRTTITYLAGMVFRRQHQDTAMTYSFPGASRVLDPRMLTPNPFGTTEIEYSSTLYSAGVAAGVDVGIKVSEHVAVVPQFRLIAANYAWSVRPAVALRWQP
jgi:hypothetical protein